MANCGARQCSHIQDDKVSTSLLLQYLGLLDEPLAHLFQFPQVLQFAELGNPGNRYWQDNKHESDLFG